MIFCDVLVLMSTWHILIFLFFQYVLLGAVPFPTDVPRLKALGVGGVVTLNEPYETLVSSSLYHVSLIHSFSSNHFLLSTYFMRTSSLLLYDTIHLQFVFLEISFLE